MNNSKISTAKYPNASVRFPDEETYKQIKKAAKSRYLSMSKYLLVSGPEKMKREAKIESRTPAT